MAKGKRLSSAKLGTLLELAHAFFTSLLMVFVFHLDVVLRKALLSVLLEELVVTTFEDVHFGVGQLRVVDGIDLSVMLTDEFGHTWGTMNRVFAVEDEKSARWWNLVEEVLCQALLIVVVDGTFDVAAFVLVFKPTVDNEDLVVVRVVLSVDDVDESVFLNAWQTIGLVRDEVGKLWLVFGVDIHDWLQVRDWRLVFL